ncbi:class V lanthionine synthetase subunit LxmK [Solwaraspora sp. WMMD791]|uniref:class V lanthionine synthetase subunit LxmK n=1 Tax=Solwaraspora sp. WMMD791 TaxID=3016086 RepID=UPI00249C45E7|nr:class V lanthionine synthetase subunit LxmK [Solwaraspora sp. WMMD791]WFE30314.1 class V lanthionine synthetase subunit LxmK [Solwaraspora sp. WMMD791]
MTTKQVTPIDLDTVPEIDKILVDLGLGPFDRGSVTSPIGRNDAWLGVTATGRDVFVKKLTGHVDDTKNRMRRLLGFEQFAAGAHLENVRWPQFIGSDEQHRVVVFERVADAINGAALMVDETFTTAHARQVGRAVGHLHASAVPDDIELDESTPAFPPVAFLEGLPLSVFLKSSAGEIEAWRLLQNDPELITAVTRLRDAEQQAPRVPSHCDLRVDQFLISDEHLFITDWEEFRLADPARDVGAFAGEWIYRSVLDLVTNRGDEAFVDTEFTHDLVLRRGVEKMRRLLPLVHEFWQAYRQVRPQVDAGLAVRATAFAGWHLLDRLVAGALSSSRLSAIQRAAAGVGRAALVNPERFATTLGFGGDK